MDTETDLCMVYSWAWKILRGYGGSDMEDPQRIWRILRGYEDPQRIWRSSEDMEDPQRMLYKVMEDPQRPAYGL